jgi:hypothetical protein
VCHIFCCPSWSFAPPITPIGCPGRGHRANSQSRSSPKTDRRHHISVRNPRPTLIGRASNRAPMSARAVAVIRQATNIITRLAFLYILSDPGQLHAYEYLLNAIVARASLILSSVLRSSSLRASAGLGWAVGSMSLSGSADHRALHQRPGKPAGSSRDERTFAGSQARLPHRFLRRSLP